MLAEGAIRKWILPELGQVLFAMKYILMLLSASFYFLSVRSVPNVKHVYQVLITILVMWCFYSAFISRIDVGITVTLVGLLIYLCFIPLIVLTVDFVRTKGQFLDYINKMLLISIPIYILGFVQYYLPPDHFLNTFVNEEQLITRVAEFTRVISVFTFVKVYNVYLLFSLSLFAAMIFVKIRRGKPIWLDAGVLLLGAVNMIMTASRLPIFMLGFILVSVLGYVFYRYVSLRKTVAVIGFSAIIVGVVAYNTLERVRQPVDALIFRIETVEQVEERGIKESGMWSRAQDRLDIFKFSDLAGYDGYGIGTTYQGTGQVLKRYISEYFEEEGERVVLELGYVGGAIIWLLRISLLVFCATRTVLKTDEELKIFMFVLTLYQLPSALFLGNTTFNYLDGFTYWLSIGLIIAMDRMRTEHIPAVKSLGQKEEYESSADIQA